MSIDHVIDYPCTPKDTLTTPGLLARIKAGQRADSIIRLYRERGDNRPPAEMGFEMVRRAADGTEEVQVVIVQDLIDQSVALDSLKRHCAGCPANVSGKGFGCFNYVNYPISSKAEVWLLKRLPTPDEPLIFLLLQQTVQDLTADRVVADQLAGMRQRPGVYFESGEVLGRRYDETTITTNHLFQLLFLPESIQPAYAALLLLLLGVIPRQMDAESLMRLTPADPASPLPVLIRDEPADDESIHTIKHFLTAVHRAHSLNVSVSLDV